MKKISLTTEDIKKMVKKTTALVLKESDVLNSAFNSGGNRGDVKVSTLNDGTIQVEIIADTYTFVTEWTGKRQAYKVGDKTVQTGYETLITKLRPFQNIAAKNGFTMEVSQPETNEDDRTTSLRVLVRITDENGNITQSIAKEGYEYCATVVPIGFEPSDGGASQNIPALVSIAPKFKNTDIGPALQSTVFKEKCAGCGRSVGRSQYVIYYNKNTNDIIKLGTNCAVNKFGYSPVGINFMKRIQLMFSTISYDDLVAHDPDGFPIQPSLSLSDMSRHSYFNEIVIPLMYHYLNEPNFRIKEYGYDMLADEAEALAKSWNSKNVTGEVSRMKEWYVEHSNDIPEFDDYKAYWAEKNPVGDWEATCKTVAMAISNESVRIPRAQVGKFTKILPYTIIDFVKNTKKPEEGGAVENQKREFAIGESVSDIPCKFVGSTFFQKFNSYLIKLQGQDGNTFSYWSYKEPPFAEGTDVVVRSAIVKKLFNGDVQLSNANVISIDRQSEIQKRTEEAEALPYPEDGTRIRNEEFKVVKTEMGTGYYSDKVKRAVIEDKNGCKYYLFLISDFEGRVHVTPFPYKEGDTLTLTGTVQKRNGKNGLYYFLNRIKIG